jgi:hypothetical protein
MRNIPAGQYRIMFQTGSSWDPSEERFRCPVGTAVVDKTEVFTEEQQLDGTEYSRIRITLHKVVRGAASTSPIAKQAFARRRR